jgi:hypothetical protein
MKLLHSGLYIYNFDLVNRYDRGRQYELQVDVGQLADDSGSVQIKIIVVSFQRLSSKQSPRDLILRRVKQPRCWQFCPNFSVVRAWTNRATSETDSTSTLLTLSAITHFMTQRNAVIMNAQRNDQTVLPNRKKNGFSADASTGLEFISVPVGSFAGTLERIIRIRDSRPVPADTGDQGGGQN